MAAAWLRYPQRGDYEEACDIVARLLEGGPCESDDVCEGCRYEWNEALTVVLAALGKPVPRQRCKVCGALDSIWWSRPADSDPVPIEEQRMWCHQCGTVSPPSEFVQLPMPALDEPLDRG